MPAPVLGRQRQLNQAPDRPISAQHRLSQLEQRIRPRGQAPVKLLPEPGQLTERAGLHGVTHPDHRSLNRDHLPWTGNMITGGPLPALPGSAPHVPRSLPGSPPQRWPA